MLSMPPCAQRAACLTVGNTHDVTPDGGHSWTLYCCPSEPTLVKAVTVVLHPSFEPSRIFIQSAPFELTRVGWGTFDIRLEIKLADGRLLDTVWPLQLEQADQNTIIELQSAPPCLSIGPSTAANISTTSPDMPAAASADGLDELMRQIEQNREAKTSDVYWSTMQGGGPYVEREIQLQHKGKCLQTCPSVKTSDPGLL
jgi:hypothetical protein